MRADLEAAVLSPLRSALGRRLESVTYAALEGECTTESLEDVPFYIGGELILQFQQFEGRFAITWDENAGWPDHFSIQVRRSSAFNAGALEAWDASDFSLWKPHVGMKLLLFRVHGTNGTPHVIEMGFPNGHVLVGDGYRGVFGDGDDLIIRTPANVEEFADWEQLAFETVDA